MSTRKGRPALAVVNAANPIGQLAEHLRKGRQSKGLTRDQLAAKLQRSVSAVQRAEHGGKPPPRHTVDDYIKNCDLDRVKTEALWKKAVNYRRGITRPNFTEAPRITLVRTEAEFGAALRRAWETHGRPSTREMEKRTDRHYQETRNYGFLSHSSACRFSSRQGIPGSERMLQAYLVALQIPERAFPAWVHAWRRVQEQRLAQRKADRSQVKMTKQTEASVAKARMYEAGLVPREKFPGAVAPWSAVHTACNQVSRYRLRSILQGAAECPVCGEVLTAGMAPDAGSRRGA
ncbi:multiprotein-bridging factor 1 family protein [Streptomyces sp. NPDC088261]|uniref:helix-turn-helix domain-containing protein n=1 Tax=Streptomyces sp. NPDC088261 TaxID=3365851 RepID=UPI0037F40F46